MTPEYLVTLLALGRITYDLTWATYGATVLAGEVS